MHRDKKLGLALGILLLGVVGAFFFRNENDSRADLPVLEDTAILDAQIAEQPITPYLPPSVFDGPSAGSLEFLAAEPPDPADDAFAGEPPDPIITRSDDLIGGAAVPEHNRAWTVSTTQPAPTEATPVAQPRTHRVQSGDTLSGIAQRYLGSSTRYLEVYAANRDVLRNPNDLRVGMTIRIPSTQPEPVDPPRNAGTTREQTARPVSATQASPAATVPPPSTPPQTQPAAPDPARRFVPARRPLWPLRRPAAESSTLDDPAPGAIRSLTQIPPADLTIESPGR